MRTLITGATGLVGSALLQSLHGKGQTLHCLRHGDGAAGSGMWPEEPFVADDDGQGFDTVIHLAGENVAQGRWTTARKQRIMESRVVGTRQLIGRLASLPRPPETVICASAVGYYGNRGDEVMTERSTAGATFLAKVCQAWEEEAGKARQLGCRVVNLRFGMVLSPHGGALHKMLPAFRAGLGGRIGAGDQFMSWISIRDLVEIVDFCIHDAAISGPVNVVSPVPVSNREFSRCLASVLRRPAFLPAPATVLRLIFGEMADEMLLASSRVIPGKLQQAGYSFQDINLVDTLRYCLG
ncbi:MAG: TIGR01777 family oxidoreductase [Desulfopila sp.]